MSVLATLLTYVIPSTLLAVVIWKFVALIFRRQWLRKVLKDFPGPKPHFWYGNLRELTGDLPGLTYAVQCAAEYSGIIPVWSGPCNCYLLAFHPAIVSALFSGADPKDEVTYSVLRNWMGDGLLLSTGKKWDRTRRLLTQAFSHDFIKNYVTIFSAATTEMVNKWQKRMGGPVEIFHDASLLTMDSMLRCLFGHASQCQEESTLHDSPSEKVEALSLLVVQRLMTPWHHWDTIYYRSENGKKFMKTCDAIHSFSRKLINRRRQSGPRMDESERRSLDLLDILLFSKDSDGQGLEDCEVQDEVDTFMFAGHASTASALSWCLYNLAKYPEYQERCRREVNTQWDRNSSLTWDDLGKLHFTTFCLFESLRLFPPVPNIYRIMDRDITLADGRIVPKGFRVGASLFAVHRNPHVWHDPEEFMPERFENNEMASATLLMPFSTGPRRCIGQHFAMTQLKVSVAVILRNFRLSLVSSQPPEPINMLVLRSKGGLYLNLQTL